MIKNIAVAAFSFFLITSCGTNSVENQKTTPNQEKVMVNQESEYNGKKIWVGEINEENFNTPDYTWYPSNYETYQVDKAIVDTFKDDLDNLDIKVFMGTWCGDSKRETPHFFKIMEYAGFPDSKIEMYGVDRSKHSLNGEEKEFEITHVPTFIFLKEGKEIGRIVESPINSLEEDIRDIVNGNPQKPNYAQ